MRQVPFRAVVENLIGLGYHIFDDDVTDWETNIDTVYFMDFGWKELELPKPEHANLLHIGWMLRDSELSGFYCSCQNSDEFDIVIKSAVPFLCPLCNKKHERWYGIYGYLEDWLFEKGFSLDTEYMMKKIDDRMLHDEKFIKDTFSEFLDRTHFDLDKMHYDYGLVRETMSKKDAGNLM